eukprot:2703577-Pyramimonas_sp.AAC.1
MLKDQHWAYQAYAVVELIGTIDESGMRKNRLQIKKIKYFDINYDTCFIRPTNGHSSPGIKCPESLYMRITDLSAPGAPCYFIRGTQWGTMPSILSIGLSCRADDAIKKRGRQFVHGCPYLLGHNWIQSGLRVDSEVLIM